MTSIKCVNYDKFIEKIEHSIHLMDNLAFDTFKGSIKLIDPYKSEKGLEFNDAAISYMHLITLLVDTIEGVHESGEFYSTLFKLSNINSRKLSLNTNKMSIFGALGDTIGFVKQELMIRPNTDLTLIDDLGGMDFSFKFGELKDLLCNYASNKNLINSLRFSDCLKQFLIDIYFSFYNIGKFYFLMCLKSMNSPLDLRSYKEAEYMQKVRKNLSAFFLWILIAFSS